MDLVCWNCQHDQFYARYDADGFTVQCVECSKEEVLG